MTERSQVRSMVLKTTCGFSSIKSYVDLLPTQKEATAFPRSIVFSRVVDRPRPHQLCGPVGEELGVKPQVLLIPQMK